MADLKFKLENQLLTKETEAVIASGDVNANTCLFTFDEAWNGYTKTAVFYQSKDSVQYAVMKSDDTCMIPAGAMLRAGIMYVGVFGVKSSSILTSTLEQVEILPGAIAEGTTVVTEPTDDIFLAIIAQYQTILEQLVENDEQYTAVMEKIDEQNKILEAIHAFDVVEVMEKLAADEAMIAQNKLMLDKNFRINDISIVFDSNSQFRYEDDRITEETLVDVYFDSLSAVTAAECIITVESFEGYILFTSTYKCVDELTASIYAMGV